MCTTWTWAWANLGRWWGPGKPGVLQSMGSQRVRRDLGTEQHHIFFIHSCELLGCFHVLAIAKSAAVNTRVRVSFQMMIFFTFMPRNGVAEWYGSSIFSFFFCCCCFPFIFISWRLITIQYYSGFCHTLTWISHGFTCIPHPDPPSYIPPYI